MTNKVHVDKGGFVLTDEIVSANAFNKIKELVFDSSQKMKITVIRAHYVGETLTQFEQKEVTEQFVKNCVDARNFFIGLGGLYKIKKDTTGRVVFIESISPDRKERALDYFVYGDIENAKK